MQLWPTVRAVSALSVLISTGLFVSCGAPRTPEPGEKRPKLTEIRILPAHPTIPKGAILRLRVEGSFDDQTTRILDWFVQWETKRSTIATIDEDGNVKAVEEGVSLVSASYQGLESRTLITVGPPALVGITVSPNQFSLPVGKSEPLTATGNFSDGTTENVTQSATWSSTALASVNTAGTAVALAVGTATINATVGTVTGSANLTVTPPVVTGLNIIPPTLSMPLGTSRQLKAVAGMSDQTTQDITATVVWSSAAAGIVNVSLAGLATAQHIGSTTILAQGNGVTSSASVTVGPPALVSIAISPSQSSLPVGESEALTATGSFSDGTVQNLTSSATWSSSPSAIASISTSGTATASAAGTAAISAVLGSITGAASLTVTPPVATSLSIVPATLSMVVGGNRQLRAVAGMSDGTTQDWSATAAWSSMQPSIVSVSPGGVLMGQQVGSTTVLAQNNGLSASAAVTVVPLVAVSYYSRIDADNSGVDGTVQLVNPGLGSQCAMVYVFDQNQELNECCGCAISDNGMRTLSVVNDLTANTLTGRSPRAGEIKVVPSDAAQYPQCDASSITPSGEIQGWGTDAQLSGGTVQVTENPFDLVPLNNSEATLLSNLCGYLKQLGSGKGICSCGTGDDPDAAASRKLRH